MRAYSIVMALHITSVAAAFMVTGALLASEHLAKVAATTGELRGLRRLARAGLLFAPINVAVFVLGLVMLEMKDGSRFHWSDAWVWSAIVALVLMSLSGRLVLAPHGRRLDAAVASAPEGPVPPAVRSLVSSPLPWVVTYANTFLTVAVILDMVAKPATGTALVVVVAGALLGAGTGRALSAR